MAIRHRSMYAILGILNLAPSTGYEIKSYSDKVLAGFWNENYGHIYPTLKMMLEEGLTEIVSSEKSKKKVRYGITEKGKQELEAWLAEETLPTPIRSEFMLKLLFSSSQPRENVIRMMKEYKELHEKKVVIYRGMQQDLEQNKDISNERMCFMNAVLRRGIMSDETVIRWCDETIEEISRG